MKRVRYAGAPYFFRSRAYRVASLNGVAFCVQYQTWILRRWKQCSAVYSTRADAQVRLGELRRGAPTWEAA